MKPSDSKTTHVTQKKKNGTHGLRESNGPSFHLRGLTHSKGKEHVAICNECARDNSRLLTPAPRASRALQGPGNGVPVLHVAPICTRLRQIRVVLQELERSSLHARSPSISTHIKDNSTCSQQKKNEICNSNKLPRENFISIAVFINLKKTNKYNHCRFQFIRTKQNLHHAFL